MVGKFWHVQLQSMHCWPLPDCPSGNCGQKVSDFILKLLRLERNNIQSLSSQALPVIENADQQIL